MSKALFITQVIAGTLSANNTTLMQTYIQPAIIQWMYFELPMVLAFKFMNKGMDRRSSTESTAMSEREMTRLMDKSRDDAEWYTERITRYLQENHTLFPLFDNPPVAIDTIYPANSAYQTGMVLGRRGHSKNVNKLKQFYEQLGDNQKRPDSLRAVAPADQRGGVRRSAGDRNGQHDKPTDSRQG